MDESRETADAPRPATTPSERIRFGAHELCLDTRRLLTAGQEIALGARAFDLLAALALRPGRVVSKRELMGLVWPTTVVEEANLRVGMSAVRKAIGADAIATIPGRGYQFAARIEAGPGRDAGPSVEGAAAPERPPARRLIGRDALLAQVGATLRSARLVTLAGHPGSGKTSLARELRSTGLPDGDPVPFHWVDLAALDDRELLGAAIAQAAGLPLRESAGHRGLVSALRALRGVLVLDNAEHLVDAVAATAHALLEGCPQLGLLVTSQVPLKLAGEVVVRVPALDVARVGTPFDEALHSPAQALFLRHCRESGRPLAIDQRTLDLVGDICSRLDGVPLAIEYAAAAVPLLGVQGVAAALEQRRLVLSAGRRDAPQRQRTLRTALDWSVSLLAPLEQLVFRRLGVFAGSCSIALFDAVVNVEGEDPWRLMEALSELIDRSLVVADEGLSPRYRLLETSRAFAVEQLNERDEMGGLRARHARAVERHFAQVRASALAGRGSIDDAIDGLLPEIDNARAAFHWALEHDAELALGLAAMLAFVLRRSGGDGEARRTLALTEALAEGRPERALDRGWLREALFQWTIHDHARAMRWIAVAEPAHRRDGDACGLIETLALKAIGLDHARDDDAQLAAVLDEILALDGPHLPGQLRVFCASAVLFGANRLGRPQDVEWAARLAARCTPGDTFGRASLVCRLMTVRVAQGRADDAIELGEPLHADLRRSRHRHALYWVPLNLVRAHLHLGHVDRAMALAREGFDADAGSEALHAWGDALSYIACRVGLHEEGARMNGFSDARHEAVGGHRLAAQAHFRDASQSLALAALGEAAYARARERGAHWEDERMLACGLRVLGR